MNNTPQVKKCFSATSGCTQTQRGVADTFLSTLFSGTAGARVALVGPSGVGKTRIVRSVAQILGKAPSNQLRSVSISCETAANVPKHGHGLLQELVGALNPAQNTNGYTFGGLEHLLEKSLTKAVPRAVPVYIFVNVASTHSEYTEVAQFLGAVQAAQTRHPNIAVVLVTADTLLVDSTYTRIVVPAITVGDVKEIAQRVAKTQASRFADDETLARATAYALQHPEPLDRITRLIRIASTLSPAHSVITIQHLDTAQTRLELAKLDTTVTPVITALSSPQTGYFLIQAAAALTRNGYEPFPITHLHRIVTKLNDAIPISPETITKSLTELIRTRIFNKVTDTQFALSPTLTRSHALNAITDGWDPFSPSPPAPSIKIQDLIPDLHLTYIAIQSALVKLAKSIPFLEIPTQETLYPLYHNTCTDLKIHPKNPSKFYDALAKLHQKELVSVARDPTGQGRPNLITSTLTKTQTVALTRYVRSLTQLLSHTQHRKNLTALKASLETTFAHAPSQKTVMACILDLARKLGKNTLRKLDIYKHYCSTCCHSTPIKQESFWALLAKLVTLRSLISSVRCFFNGSNEARILIADTGPP